MSFPPPLPNNPVFQAYAQAAARPIPGFQLPIGGLPVPLVPPSPLPMGVTVPAGVASISAPPVRNQNPAVIAAPPVMSLSGPPPMLYPPANLPSIPEPKPAVHVIGPPPKSRTGHSITVFVGNITDRASDMLIRQLLSKCGAVNNWKRVQGPNGKLQAFGFCDYADPESAMRAIRLLHQFEIADKQLIVKVDAKTQEKLDEYLKSKNPQTPPNSDLSQSPKPENDKNDDKTETKDEESSQNVEPILDEYTKEQDKFIKNQLFSVLKEHELELSKEPEDKKKKHSKDKDKDKEKDKAEDINDLDMEDDKRNLIHREIDKFRDTYKKYDEEKEEEKRKKEEELSRRERKDDFRRSWSRDRDRDEKRDDRRDERRDDRREDRDRRDYRRDDRRDDRRDRSGRSNRDKRPRRSTTPDTPSGSSGSLLDEEDIATKRRNEQMIREKEISFQRRVRDWEEREARKARDYERENQKEARYKQEIELEKQKLKQFLQDYDDDKHDSKYYSGRLYHRRLAERKKEIEKDAKERELEKKELEELKKKLIEEGHPDPDAEVRKRLNVNDNEMNERIKSLMNEARHGGSSLLHDSNSNSSNIAEMAVKTFGFAGMKISTTSDGPLSNGASSGLSTTDALNENSNSSLQLANELKRKRLMMSDIFNSNEDDETSLQNGKKRRPPPNALLEDNTDSNLSTGSNSKQFNAQLSQEEKRRQIKSLIDKIPTAKNELFNYNIEWDLLDSALMERRIKPWINKKISDYIGEEEQTLLDFICKKLLMKSSAQSLLDDVAMVLDEEAQVFVVKLWRLLIYEIESKKIGLTRPEKA